MRAKCAVVRKKGFKSDSYDCADPDPTFATERRWCQGISVDGATELRRRLSYVGDVAPPTRTPVHAHAKRTPQRGHVNRRSRKSEKPQRRLPCGLTLAAPCEALGTPNMRGILSVGTGAPGRGSKAPKKSRIESSILRLPRVVCGFAVVPRT